MTRLARTPGLTDVQRDILAAVREFVDKEIIPHAQHLEHADEYPEEIVAGMAGMGLFGLTIAEEYGGLGVSLLTYALVVEELSRGWMSLSGILNTHFIVAYLLSQHGTESQRERLLPRLATGEVRGAFSMSEPDCGSDVAAITSRAERDADGWVMNARKMWLTNGARAGVVAVLVRTSPPEAGHRGMTTFLLEKEPGFGDVGNGVNVGAPIPKLGYKGVETVELVVDGARLPTDAVIGGEDGVGRGFYQMMDGIEVGRV